MCGLYIVALIICVSLSPCTTGYCDLCLALTQVAPVVDSDRLLLEQAQEVEREYLDAVKSLHTYQVVLPAPLRLLIARMTRYSMCRNTQQLWMD